jgi:hypothetical protein
MEINLNWGFESRTKKKLYGNTCTSFMTARVRKWLRFAVLCWCYQSGLWQGTRSSNFIFPHYQIVSENIELFCPSIFLVQPLVCLSLHPPFHASVCPSFHHCLAVTLRLTIVFVRGLMEMRFCNVDKLKWFHIWRSCDAILQWLVIAFRTEIK